MLSLQRRRNGSSLVANLALTYDGNRLTGVTDSGSENPGSFVFDYDASGNMTKDGRKSLEISSNVLNLPMTVSEMTGTTVTNTMTYTYLGDGTKVAARASDPDAGGHAGMRYRGSFVYDVTSSGGQTLQSIAVSTGRLIAVTGSNGSVSFESDGFITDHLGNVAAVVNLSAPASTSTANFILEQNDYLPFGSIIALKEQSTNRYRYAGKEEQDIAGMDLGLSDFGARYYDSFIPRWNAIDPLAHEYFSMSPYCYCGNDPVNSSDPDGRAANIVVGAISGAALDYGIQVLSNIISGKNLGEALTDIDGKSIIISAGSGAAGVGLVSKIKQLSNLGKSLKIVLTVSSESGVGAVTSVVAQLSSDGTVSIDEVAFDAALSAMSAGAGEGVKFLKQSSQEYKQALKELDHAQRVAGGNHPRQSRLEKVKAAQEKLDNVGNFESGLTESSVTIIGKTSKNVIKANQDEK